MATSQLEIIVGLKDQASGPLGGLRRALGGIGQIAGGILGAQAIGGLINGVKGMATEAFNAVADFERLGASMEALAARELRSEDATLGMEEALKAAGPRAQELLKWVEQLAIKSPFDQAGVALALKTAMAYGFTSEQAQKLTEVSIDFVAATGGTSEQMNSIALALGQMQAKGKVSGQELLQLTNAGVGVNDILESMGFTLKDVEKGLVSSDAFFEAFTKTMDEDFGGAAERQAGTWAGLVSTLGDVKKIGLREFFGGVFKAVQPLVAKLAEWLQGPGLEKLKQWGEAVGNMAARFVEWLQGPEFAAIVQWLQINIPLAIQVLSDAWNNVLLPAIQAVWGWMNTVLMPFLQGVVFPWLAQNIPVAIQTLSGFWTNTLQPALQTVWAFIQNNVVPVLSDVWSWLQTNIPVAIQTLSDFWNNTLLPALQAGDSFFRDNILPVLTDVRLWLAENVPAAIQTVSDFWNNTLLPAITAVWSFFSTYIAPILTTVADILGITLSIAITAVAGLWENILLPAITKVYDFVKDKIGPKLKWLKDEVIVPLKNAISSLVTGALQWLLDKLEKLKEKLENITLPDWLTPGSPTPLEMGIRGISSAVGALNNKQFPGLSGGNSTPGPGGGLYIGSQSITIMNGSDIDEIMDAIQRANQQSMHVGSVGYAG